MNDRSPATTRQRRGGDPRGSIEATVVEFCSELRDEGLRVGTSELLDAFAALAEVDWSEQVEFREALAATVAKSQDDRELFELVFDRFFFRAAEAQMLAIDKAKGTNGNEHPDGAETKQTEGASAGAGAGAGEAGSPGDEAGEHPIDLEALREAIMDAIENGNASALRDLAKLSVMALAGGPSSGVIGVDVQRVRRSLQLRAQDLPPGDAGAEARKQLQKFERHVRRELEAAMIAKTGALPSTRPLNELNRALPTGAADDLAAVHRSVKMLKRAMATQGLQQRGRRRGAIVDVRHTMRASLETGGVPINLRHRPRSPRRPELYVLCDVSTSVTSASVFFLSILDALHDSFKRLRSFVFIERVAEVTDVFQRERSFEAASERISNTAGVADISGYTDYGRVWQDFHSQVESDLGPRSTVIVLGDARTNGREPRADLFGAVANAAGRTFWLNPEPRLYWNYGDSVIGVYEKYCDGIFECWTSKQLEAFVRTLAAAN